MFQDEEYEQLLVIKTPVTSRINSFGISPQRVRRLPSSIRVMVTCLLATLAYLRAFLMARHSLAMETAALRQQLAVTNGNSPDPS
ncbi:MAG: hypothetical protein JO108_13470 [Acidobacteriaceae bacterium]|nr:hypothetical protein [Acidobacteriaceae bacterium]